MTMLLRRFFSILFGILLWQAIVQIWQLPTYLLPSPIQVFFTLIEQSHLILEHAIPTLIETVLGFACGILLGCLAAIVIFFFQPLRYWFWPLLIISQAIPTFAIAPLLVMWLGYGLASKIATTVIMLFFPITSALYDGLRHTRSDWLNLAKGMNAKKWRIFYHIQLPAAYPSLASGIRIAAVIAPIGAIIGEWVGSSRGLGYLMLNANARMQIDMMFATLAVIIVFSLTLYFTVDKLLNSWIKWQS
jgi:putative hydroxymethylpyrimidine transport system permease protein